MCVTEAGGKRISFITDPSGLRRVQIVGEIGDTIVLHYSDSLSQIRELPTWGIEVVQNHRDDFRRFAPQQLALLEQEYAALAQAGAPSTTVTAPSTSASSTDSRPPRDTQSSDASADISSQCRDTDRQTTRRYLGEANAAM